MWGGDVANTLFPPIAVASCQHGVYVQARSTRKPSGAFPFYFTNPLLWVLEIHGRTCIEIASDKLFLHALTLVLVLAMPGGCVCMRAPRRCWDHGVPKPAFTMLQRRCCVHVIARGPARSMRAFVGRMRPSSVRQRALGSTRMHGGSFQRLTSLPPPRAPSPVPTPPP